MTKKILVVIAHPDDESFAMAGTLAKYAAEGVEIHVLCATRGENGRGRSELAVIREQELRKASEIIGVQQVEFMGFIDGMLSNSLYHEMADKILSKINHFKPHIVLTLDRLGVSGHIDHIMVSMVTTFVCKKLEDRLKLFYFCESRETTDLNFDYFIYFPPGIDRSQADVIIDISDVWDTKVDAIEAHVSQAEDGKKILGFKQNQPKEELYVQAFKKKSEQLTSTDFFTA